MSDPASPILGRSYEESLVDPRLPRTGRGFHIDEDRDDTPPVTEYGPPAYWDKRGPDTYGQDWKAELRRILREELDRRAPP